MRVSGSQKLRWSLRLLLVGGACVAPATDATAANGVVSESSGSASWSIPIAAPPGPGGFAPSLGLTYSSRGGDGPFGVGWSLGIPEIRCSARFGVPDLASCARYELGDTLLVRVGSTDRYHTIVESFQRILFQSGSNSTWTVEQPNGTKLTFGGAPTYRIVQGTATAVWLLERMEDAFGNTIFFSYNRSDLGQPYPSKITYGAGEREIEFVYANRADPRLFFTGGIERHLTRRLKEIQVISGGGMFRRYSFGFQPAGYATDRTRLTSVQEFGADCPASAAVTTCTGLPKRTFRYRDAADPEVGNKFEDQPAYRVPFGSYDREYPWTGREDFPSQVGDLNGDGLPDRIELDADNNFQVAHTFQVFINTGAGFTTSGADADAYRASFASLTYTKPYWEYEQIPAPITSGIPQEYSWNQNIPAGGESGPTMYAMCSVEPRTRTARLSQELFTRGAGARTSPISDLRASDGDPSLGFFEPLPSFRLVDVDADGLADLVISTHMSGVTRHFDCNDPADPLENPQSYPAQTITEVFRNTGSSWVSAPELAAGLPAFEQVIVKSTYQTESEEPSQHILRTDFNAHSACANRSVWGFEQLRSFSGNVATSTWAVCHTMIDLAPEFADFNGDGYPDIAVLERANPHSFYTGAPVLPPNPQPGYQGLPANPARTRVWIQKPGQNPRWQEARQFDLPLVAWPQQPWIAGFAHAGLQHYLAGVYPSQCMSMMNAGLGDYRVCSPNTYRSDLGVRLVDLNRDGLTDVVWSFNGTQQGVFLNTGRGTSDASSAWCASNNDDDLVGSECPEAAAYVPPAPLAKITNTVLPITSGQLGDFNGDGWLDFIAIDRVLTSNTWPVWIQDPDTAASVWRPDDRFDLIFSCHNGCPAVHPANGSSTEDVVERHVPIDINGDGSDDVVGDRFAFLSRARHGDLLREVKTGRGGTIAFDYKSMSGQRDEALEVVADLREWADAAGDVALWRSTPVVSRVTLSGPNIASPGDFTDFRYAHPRFDRALRSDLGFGLVLRTRAGGASEEEYFYQDLGRTGRTAWRIAKSSYGGTELHRYLADWESLPPSTLFPGKAAGTYLARLVSEETANRYDSEISGSLQTRSYAYHPSYGFNFVSEIRTTRVSTGTTLLLEPEPAVDGTKWIAGLVRERRLRDERGSGWESKSVFTYTPQGRLASEVRHNSRGTGLSVVPETTLYGYDGFGNLASQTDGEGQRTEFGYDATQTLLTSRTDPPLAGETTGKVTTLLPHPVFGVPFEVIPPYRDLPHTRQIFDPFGRVTQTWQIPHATAGGAGGTAVLVSETIFDDAASPSSRVEKRAYTEASEFIRTKVVEDGFGGAWKTIRHAGPGNVFVGSATYHFPAQRRTFTTEERACANSWCTTLIGDTELPRVDTVADALGRPLSVATSRGSSLFHYESWAEPVVEGGVRVSRFIDVAWSQNAKGDLTRRGVDGDRVLLVDECTNSDASRATLEGATCAAANGANRTLYGYHATGQIEAVYDPIAVAVASQWTNPSHRLVYRYDTAGQLIAIHDPDARSATNATLGVNQTFYDRAGQVVATWNARNQIRSTAYDALGRPTQITLPPSEGGPITFTYRADEFGVEREAGPGYAKSTTYDDFGRVASETLEDWQSATYEYDRQGRTTRIEPNWDGPAVRYEYAGAYLTAVCLDAATCAGAASPILSNVTYDALGRRKTATLPGGVRTFTYEDDGDPDPNARRDLVLDQFAGGLSALTTAYPTRDALGNVLTWSSTAPAGTSLGNASGSYSYDARNRLASWTRSGAPTEHFLYDALGNLTQHAGVAQTFDATNPHAIASRPDKTYAYEGGNLRRAGNRHYTFDSADRMTCVGTTAGGCDVLRVTYDAAGSRVYEQAPATRRGFLGPDLVHATHSEGHEWRLDLRAWGEVVAYVAWTGGYTEPDEAAAPPWLVALVPLAGLGWGIVLAIRGGLLVGVARRPGYATLSGVLIGSLAIPFPIRAGGGGEWDSDRFVRWVLADPLGSGVAVVDEDGLLLHQTRFEPFGAPDATYHAPGAINANEPQNRRLFAGHSEQQETQLTYMNARWQDPETGMFLSVDPVVPDMSDPQAFNAYAYARNNPVNLTDPTGMCILGFFGGCQTQAVGYSTEGGVPTITIVPIADTSSSGGAGSGSSGLGSLSSLDVGGPATGGLNGGGGPAAPQSNPGSPNPSNQSSPNPGDSESGPDPGESDGSDGSGDGDGAGCVGMCAGPGDGPQEANLLGWLVRGAQLAGKGAKYAKYVWKNTNFDGPSPGVYYFNGRIAGVRWKQSQWGARLDIHPLDVGGPPVLHINYGPLDKGEAAHIRLFDPRWLRRDD